MDFCVVEVEVVPLPVPVPEEEISSGNGVLGSIILITVLVATVAGAYFLFATSD